MESFTPPDENLVFRVQLEFGGYALPHPAFHGMVMMFLEMFFHPLDKAVVKKNGAIVESSCMDFAVSFVHDIKGQVATIELSDKAHSINDLWNQLDVFTDKIITKVLDTWKAVRVKCIFFCPHCLLTSKAHPKKETNPFWCCLSPQLSRSSDGTRLVSCGEDQGIMSCLRYPCKPLTSDGMRNLEDYIRKVTTPTTAVQRSQDMDDEAATRPEGDEDGVSDISDGEDYRYGDQGESVECVDMGTISLIPTSRRSIRELYLNTDQVYKMSSPLRGRALIINNKTFSVPGYSTRVGSEVDVRSLRDLFTGLGFESIVKMDLTAQDMKSVIHEETRNEDHDDYGIFILVIMSHGSENDRISGTDGHDIKLSDVHDLLSAGNFSRMRGRPKFIITQACSGSRRDLGVESAVRHSRDSQLTTDTPSIASDVRHLDPDDFIFIKSSFETFVSLRHETGGSLFIRCLVATFKKHACHRDILALLEIVKEKVRKGSMELARMYPEVASGQIPVYWNTLTNYRKVYLFPGLRTARLSEPES
ncbi:caspase-2-like [Watersipora subatra]|uniref:caspase-2-like n=1 Tax=Watersipora subatra TaxID=2589382 RepID=UPI00355BB9CD